MVEIRDALSWNGTPVVSLFLVTDGERTPALELGALGDSVTAVRRYELEDELRTLGGRRAFEYDIEFSQLPGELTQALANVLLAARDNDTRVAWLGFEGSFSFNHLLSDDVAEQVYGVRIAGAQPEIELDAVSRTKPRWIGAVRRARQLAV